MIIKKILNLRNVKRNYICAVALIVHRKYEINPYIYCAYKRWIRGQDQVPHLRTVYCLWVTRE